MATAPPATPLSLSLPLWRCATTASSTALCFRGAVTLPRKIGTTLLKEKFRALLCLYNAATYPLCTAHLLVSITQQRAQQKAAPFRRTVPVIAAKSTYVYVLDTLLADTGAHTLAVRADYVDPSHRQRQLVWSSSLNVEAPVMEVVPRQLRCTTSWSSSVNATADKYIVYSLSMGLQNASSVPLLLLEASLQLPSIMQQGEPLFVLMPPPHEVRQERLGEEGAPRSSSNGGGTAEGGSSCSTATCMMPSDKYLLTFQVGILRREHRPGTVCHVPGGVATPLLPPRLGSLGRVMWRWSRENGASGSMESAPLLVESLPAMPEVVLAVAAVDHRTPFATTGSPVVLRCTVENHGGTHCYDLAVKMRVERLAPLWLYTGPTLLPLGFLEPHETISFMVELRPWQSGWLSVARDVMELVDARAPATSVLWPTPPSLLVASPTGSIVSGRGGVAGGMPMGKIVGPSTAEPSRSPPPPMQGTAAGVAEERLRGQLMPAFTTSLCHVFVV